jgi:hypothetical protein
LLDGVGSLDDRANRRSKIKLEQIDRLADGGLSSCGNRVWPGRSTKNSAKRLWVGGFCEQDPARRAAAIGPVRSFDFGVYS